MGVRVRVRVRVRARIVLNDVFFFFFPNTHEGNNVAQSWFAFYVKRVWRVWPPVCMIILIYIAWQPFAMQQQAPPIVQNALANCERNWWATLMMIQNIILPYNETCISHSWYICVEIQLYIISPLLIWLLKRHHNWGISTIILLLCISWLSQIAVVMKYHLHNGLEPHQQFEIYRDMLYVKTHSRAPPYFIGILLFYLYRKYALEQIRKHKKRVKRGRATRQLIISSDEHARQYLYLILAGSCIFGIVTVTYFYVFVVFIIIIFFFFYFFFASLF